MVKKEKFIIVSPRQKYGGAIVLHCLCKYLYEYGYDAKIFYANSIYYKKGKRIISWLKYIKFTCIDLLKVFVVKNVNESKLEKYKAFDGYVNIPIKGCKRKYLPIVDKNTIVVYPDVIYGNFLNAKNVVRWFLYYNRFPNDENAYGKNDLFICFREIFNDKKLNPDCNIVCMNYFDLDLYKQTNFKDRQGVCYIIRKGRNRDDLPEKFDGIIIDDLPEHEKVKVFNECKYCISYDTQTAYSSIAALCGCISIIVPEHGKNKSDYRNKDEVNLGVAFGFDEKEIEYAIKTRKLIKEHYVKTNEEGKKSVYNFINLCKEHFKH